MIYYSVTEIDIIGERKSEFSLPSDYQFGYSTSELQETRGRYSCRSVICQIGFVALIT